VHAEQGLRCWACHQETPHGRVRGLAAVPYEHIPLVGSATPAWLRDLVARERTELNRIGIHENHRVRAATAVGRLAPVPGHGGGRLPDRDVRRVHHRARTEAVVAGVPVQPLPEFEPRNAVWGQQFRRQFQSYLQTLDTTFASKYGGARHRDMLAQHPEMVVLWAGYAFARDYDQIRGHYYAVKDVHQTLRTNIDQPATCWTCKSTDVPRLMNEHGVAGFYAQTWRDLGEEVVNPIGCQDCHDPTTMRSASRPALVEALERMGRNIDQIGHQEMRTRWCAPSATWSTTSGMTELPGLPLGRERPGYGGPGGVPRPGRATWTGCTPSAGHP
jgi:hypothetical protein